MPKTDLILLALNSSPTLQLLERALRAASYSVGVASDPDALEKTLLETTPSLLVIGESLRGKDGFVLAAAALDRFPTLPVILFADQDSPELYKKALYVGLSDVLTPPLRIDQIVESIKRNLNRAKILGDWVRREVKHSTASLEKRINELEKMTQLGRTITGSLDLDRVLTSVVNTAVEVTGAEEGSILLLDEQTGELYIRAERNLGDQQVHTFRLKVDDSLAGQVIRTGEPVDLSNDLPTKIKTAYLVHSLIYVPLRVKDKIIGVLGVDNRQSKLPFREHYVLLLSLLGDYAANAIENARLFQNTEGERAKLDIVLKNIDDGVIVLNDDRRVIFINPAARYAFGLGLTGVTGSFLPDLVKHHDLDVLLDSAMHNPLKHHEVAFEDGRTFNVQYAPIEGVGSVLTMQEITHLKMIDRLKSDFIHTVSHDLRSPLTSIMGYVELLDRVGPVNEQQKEFLRRIQASTQNITALINDLLDLGRIESGFDTRKDFVAMDGVLRYTLDNLAKQIVDKQLTLKVNVPSETTPVLGNPVRLRQVMDNLVGNAVKYTPDGGSISLDMDVEDGQLIICIADTGVGIPIIDQPYIFEKFYRASNAPKGTPGTGLGLAIVKSIIDNHNGRIWLESSPGKGTKFFVVLPLYKPDAKSPANL